MPSSTGKILDQIPVVDFRELGDDKADGAIARQLDEAFSNIGFCYFTGIGVTSELRDALFDASRRFHALPEATKRAIAMNEFHRGYMAPNTSVIATSTVAVVTKPNYSESLMIMHEIEPDDPRFGEALQGPNRWPADLPGFKDSVLAYEAALQRFAQRLLRPLALALSLPPAWFAPFFVQPTTFLRLLHYPPQPPDSPDDAFGSAPHTDYGFITLLAQDNSGGLEVRRSDGVWLPAPPLADTIVVNVGDMLSRWTNGRWQSTPHRVKNLSGNDRYSCPYFFDMSMDSVVECLPSCVGADTPARFPPVRYGDYLMERLNKNYAYRQKAG
jgi:isopenicillin N synthase-like dioxygenase